MGEKVLIQSKDEQDRLYKEAEASFAQRGTDEVKESGDDNREQRIRDLEDRIRAEIMSRKNETPGYRNVQAEEQNEEEEENAIVRLLGDDGVNDLRAPAVERDDLQQRQRRPQDRSEPLLLEVPAGLERLNS